MVESRRNSWEDWVRRNHVESRIILICALSMLFWVTDWSFHFASSSKFDGMGTAAVITSVQLPATWFVKEAYNTWKEIVK